MARGLFGTALGSGVIDSVSDDDEEEVEAAGAPSPSTRESQSMPNGNNDRLVL